MGKIVRKLYTYVLTFHLSCRYRTWTDTWQQIWTLDALSNIPLSSWAKSANTRGKHCWQKVGNTGGFSPFAVSQSRDAKKTKRRFTKARSHSAVLMRFILQTLSTAVYDNIPNIMQKSSEKKQHKHRSYSPPTMVKPKHYGASSISANKSSRLRKGGSNATEETVKVPLDRGNVLIIIVGPLFISPTDLILGTWAQMSYTPHLMYKTAGLA